MPQGEKEACTGEKEDGAMEIDRERGNRAEIPENEKMKKKERPGGTTHRKEERIWTGNFRGRFEWKAPLSILGSEPSL